MLDRLAATIVQALGFGVACVNIARPDGTLEVVSVAGDDEARKKLLGSTEGAEVWDRMLKASEPWGLLRFADHLNEAASVDTLTWIPSFEPIDAEDAWHPEDALFAPLTAADGSRLGILSVDCPHDGRRPDRGTQRALEAFAISAALAIEHASLRARAEASERRFRHLARHDPLTGVGNRSLMVERLEHAVTMRAGERTLMAVVFVDLDDFKLINDRHSHDAGDYVLKTVAQRIETVVRPHDTVARWGGDEFLVLLERLADEESGVAIAQRITTELAAPLRRFGRDLTVTASVGLAFRHAEDTDEFGELIKRADASMYRVKQGGRNAYAVHPCSTDPVSEPLQLPSPRSGAGA
jgi:diguanylate cyclase (GGDEF)-like protein